MAHFWGWLRGEHGKKVTHTGSDTSGLNAVLNGFSFGVRVSLYNDGKEDKAEIYLTFGSNEEVSMLKPESLGLFSRHDLINLIRKKHFREHK